MNVKAKGHKLIDADFIEPETVIAEVNGGYLVSYVKRLALTLTLGHKMIMTYQKHRENFHIADLAVMLDALEEVYKSYSYELEVIKRSEWKL